MNLKEKKVYEIAIIGGGAAGLYLANKLNNKKDLILIESGPSNKFNRNNRNHKFIMHKNTKHKLNTDQVSGIGGNTNIWGGQLLPFTKNDINKKNGWPIEWEEISEIYKSITKELLNENIKFYSQEYMENSTKTKTLKSKQIEFNVHLSSWLKEPNFKKLYLKKIMNKNDILSEYYVDFIGYEKNKYYELYCLKDNNKIIIRAKKVIIACGAIQSVRLLLNSSKINNLLKNKNIGKNFMDHAAIKFTKLKVKNRFKFLSLFNTKFTSNGNKVSIRLSASAKYLKNNKANISGMFMIIPPGNIFKRLINIITMIFTRKFLGFIYKPFGEIVLCFLVEQKNTIKNKIDLTKNGMPIINWHIDKQEINVIKDFAKKILSNKEVRKLIKNNYKFPNRNIIFSKTTDNNHPMGGALMHIDKNKRVVDSNLEVDGCKGLFVCSTAIFPSGSHSNPTMTLLAFANRLAHKLNFEKT
tara:strand:+ start:209 stop:1615 length:1407 start_codon:yes stop_codon:yes gene_type:complete